MTKISCVFCTVTEDDKTALKAQLPGCQITFELQDTDGDDDDDDDDSDDISDDDGDDNANANDDENY